ncbi:DUF4012 domain-containing protein, partial [Aeromicrobium sp.]|uniref:DUF4012 domain-containing protein n=1 Tax=Aeromicrobium sp. TaxID=1871063 RepID=UPI003C5D8959
MKISRGHIGVGAALMFGLVVVVFAIQAAQASSALRLAAGQAEVLKNEIVIGDNVRAKSTLAALQSSAARAHNKTDGLLWELGSRVPFAGRNVSAIRTVAEVVDDIAVNAMPPIVGLSEQINLKAFSPRKGKVDLEAIVRIRPAVIKAATTLTTANDQVKDIDSGSLFLPIRGPIAVFQTKLKAAQSAAVNSRSAARLMPSMLGAKETRRYLLLVQNNAEIRPTGGIAGSFAVLKSVGGKLSMGQQGSIQDLLPFPDPVLPMGAEESSVFTSSLVSDLRDINLTPHFPRTGEIAQAMAKKGLGVEIDGVVSVDPIAMSYLLNGTGPVQLKDGTMLNQGNAVSVLLNRVYTKYQDNNKQDDLFESAARRIFNVVKSGTGDPRSVIGALVNAADENRLTLWSSHEAEQAEIARTGVSGIVGGDDGDTPHVGVYLSDSASTKMEYYLDYRTGVRSGRCLAGDIQELSTTTELTSNAPSKGLPQSVTGSGDYTPPGTMKIVMRLYSPYDGGFTEVRVNGKKQTVYA